MYKLETHCHTKIISRCGKMTAQEVVELYSKNGYNGIFITEHFLNSDSCRVIHDYASADYKTKIDKYCEGYLKVKECAKGVLDVFFGLEFSYLGTDMLVYGLDAEKLKKMPEIMQMSMRDFIDFARLNGALVVHAHPFREANYIDHIRLYPNVEAVEVYNACRTDLCNCLGENYAKSYNKLCSAGTDIHAFSQPILSGMAFEEKVSSVEHFITLIREGKGEIIKQKNILIKE